MRALVLADIHSNIEALRAVIADASRRGLFDAIWCLGDIVGYGPEPEACIDLIQSYPHEAVAGNHDLAAVGAIDTADFNQYAAAAAHWTATRLRDEHKVWLLGLPRVQVLEEGFTLTHGSLVDPVWEYLIFADSAHEHLARQTTPYGLVGHTHLPRVFYDTRAAALSSDIENATEIALDESRFVANPGSVGQPRDGDPRAAYAIADTDARRLSFHRIEYNIAQTQQAMVEAGLPMMLVERLSRGR